MYQIITFYYGVTWGEECDGLGVQEQFNRWAEEQGQRIEVVQIHRSEVLGDYGSQDTLTVLYKIK